MTKEQSKAKYERRYRIAEAALDEKIARRQWEVAKEKLEKLLAEEEDQAS